MSNLRPMLKEDLDRVNMLLSKAFTQARQDEGYHLTHVPMCRLEFLEMYQAECPKGCFVIEEGGVIQAASFCHLWGQTGWIGPLAVTPDKHLLGYGKEITRRAVSFLTDSGCTIIGLETSPRSYRNLGFYGKLGFSPQSLIVDLTRRVTTGSGMESLSGDGMQLHSDIPEPRRAAFCTRVRQLVQRIAPGLDYTPLIRSVSSFSYGDSMLFFRHGVPVAYCTVQSMATSAEEKHAILRVVAFLAHPKTPAPYFPILVSALEKLAHQRGAEQLLFRVPARRFRALSQLLDLNYRIIHTDLRMTLDGYGESDDPDLYHFNRWV